MTGKTICTICGVTSVSWVGKKLGQAITIRRGYMPTTIVFRLKPETTSSFIVRPEIERMAVHIRSLDDHFHISTAGRRRSRANLPPSVAGGMIPSSTKSPDNQRKIDDHSRSSDSGQHVR